MKGKLFDRVLLAILLILVIAISITFIMVACRVFLASEMQAMVEQLYYNDIVAIVLGVCSAALLIIAIRLLFFGGKKRDLPEPTSTLVRSSELGSTFIALSAIDSMVQKHCRSNNRIRSVMSVVHALRDGGITINIRLSLMPDNNIPELTDELQKSLKEYIEQLSGITVREIGILVEDTSISAKARVE